MYLSSILSSIENTIKEQNPGSKMYPKALNNQYGIDMPLVGKVIISLLFITGTPVIFEYKYNENTIIAVIMHMNIFIFFQCFCIILNLPPKYSQNIFFGFNSMEYFK